MFRVMTLKPRSPAEHKRFGCSVVSFKTVEMTLYMSHVKHTELHWQTIYMQTGVGKSTLCKLTGRWLSAKPVWPWINGKQKWRNVTQVGILQHNVQHTSTSECLVCRHTWHWNSVCPKTEVLQIPVQTVAVCFRGPTEPWRMRKGSVGSGRKDWGLVGIQGPGEWPLPQEEPGQLRMLQPPPHSIPTHTQVSSHASSSLKWCTHWKMDFTCVPKIADKLHNELASLFSRSPK